MNRMKKRSVVGGFLAGILFLPPIVARADVMYQCVDNQGHKTFSNVRLSDKNVKCAAMDLGPTTTVPGQKPASKPAGVGSAPGTGSSSGFPKVGESAQKERDTDRRRILEGELDAEKKNLEQAKKELSEQEAIRLGDEKNYQRVLDRLEPFKNKVSLHERNIEAIEKELAKLR